MSTELIYQYLEGGSYNVTVPSGYSNQVIAYTWGAGGAGHGGGGGYVTGILTVSSGSTITVSVGSTTGNGNNPFVSLNGGTGKSPGANGGGATSIYINGIAQIVAAGGGGGGQGSAGLPGGNYPTTNINGQGQNAINSGQGGGGGGYPNGGGLNANNAGGSGGQNYANILVNSVTISEGSGSTPGGTNSAYYPSIPAGSADTDGAVILIFQKTFTSWIKESGAWKSITNAWVKTPSNYVTYTPSGTAQTLSYISGSTTFTVPQGVTSIAVTATGGGGGGGGNDSHVGYSGFPGEIVSGTLSVTPGDILIFNTGGGGLGGASGTQGGGGAYGVDPYNTYNGGGGGGAGNSGSSGAGGGGGAASSVYHNGTVFLVAAGGGGGGGGGNYSNGLGQQSYSSSGSTNGGNGIYHSGDGGGSGGGGGGYPDGGAGGASVGGDNGSYSGSNGQSLVPGGGSSSAANNGGVVPGGPGGNGSIVITYTPVANPVTVDEGGWKPIVQAWVKQSGQWKSIESPLALVPEKSSNVPSQPVTVNLVIATNTNNYDLATYLAQTNYYPGYSIVTLTVNSGITVGSTNVLTPAIIIDGLAAGDQFTLINNGTISGAGGQGGSAGSYTPPTAYHTGKFGALYSYNYSPKGVSTEPDNPGVSIPGGPGFQGGAGLTVNYQTTLVNNGTIAGGGGGGGGGGGPTGGQGGGGAGTVVGIGANNGTSTSGGAGTGYGGAGGALGTPGSAGANDVGGSGGGIGGAAGPAVVNSINVVYSVTGTLIGPLS